MIKHAWDGYAKYAFGDNELKPVSRRGHSAAIFGKTRLGATLVDSLDTLYIAGLYDEFNQGRDWVKDNFNIDEVICVVCTCTVHMVHNVLCMYMYTFTVYDSTYTCTCTCKHVIKHVITHVHTCTFVQVHI